MTDEEARQKIINSRGGDPDNWLAKRLIIVYEKFRHKGLEIPEALEQTQLCYLASIGAATYDKATGRYRSNYDNGPRTVSAGEAAGGAG